jgi:catalase
VSEAVTPAEAIDVANEVFGSHRGQRALHAKGLVCAGTFQASAAAAALTSAAHMQGLSVPTTVRFSNGSGDPEHPDWMPEPRGLAVKFYLPDDSRTDIVAVSTPIFPVSRPDQFIEILKAQAGGRAAAGDLVKLLALNPRSAAALARAAPSLRPAAAYSTIPYHALHAYRWLAADGSSRWVRYRWLPVDGVSHLSPLTARRRGPDYLIDGLRERLARSPVQFSLEIQIAGEGDVIDDPSRGWPSGRERVVVGTLSVTGVDSTREKDGDVLVFDPTRVTPGIVCSQDPILLFRRAAYSESVARRIA